MLAPAELYSFISVIMIMIITPGPNQVLVIETGAVLGYKAAMHNILGILTAQTIHALLSGLGLSVIIAQSANIYLGLKAIGALYIIYLGVIGLYHAYRLRQSNDTENATGDKQNIPNEHIESNTISFRKGFITNILNIQTAFIFLFLFPQFLHTEKSILLQSFFLTLIFISMQIFWYFMLILSIHKFRHVFMLSKTQKWIKVLTGSLLLSMGLEILLHSTHQ